MLHIKNFLKGFHPSDSFCTFFLKVFCIVLTTNLWLTMLSLNALHIYIVVWLNRTSVELSGFIYLSF